MIWFYSSISRIITHQLVMINKERENQNTKHKQLLSRMTYVRFTRRQKKFFSRFQTSWALKRSKNGLDNLHILCFEFWYFQLSNPILLTLSMILMSTHGTVSRTMFSVNLEDQSAPFWTPTARSTSLSRSSFSSTRLLMVMHTEYMKASTRNMGRIVPILWIKLGIEESNHIISEVRLHKEHSPWL